MNIERNTPLAPCILHRNRASTFRLPVVAYPFSLICKNFRGTAENVEKKNSLDKLRGRGTIKGIVDIFVESSSSRRYV